MEILFPQGQATDIQIQAEEILKIKTQINQLYVKHTKQPLETIGRKEFGNSLKGQDSDTVIQVFFFFLGGGGGCWVLN